MLESDKTNLFFLSLSKQAYVQQLESSRIKLSQLEQDLQRARAQVNLIFYSLDKTDQLIFLKISYFKLLTY
jgi:hypothetical protein